MYSTKEIYNIFIVEDDPVFIKNVSINIGQNRRYRIFEFNSGEACISAMSKQPDIIILDINLGGMNGEETLKKIKEIKPDTHVIVSSGQESVQTAMDVLEGGAFEYIVKNENSIPRIKNSLRNIVKNTELRDEVINLNVKISKYKLYLYGTIIGVVIMLILSILFPPPSWLNR